MRRRLKLCSKIWQTSFIGDMLSKECMRAENKYGPNKQDWKQYESPRVLVYWKEMCDRFPPKNLRRNRSKDQKIVWQVTSMYIMSQDRLAVVVEQRLEKKLKTKPTQSELFRKTKMRYDGSFVDAKSKKIYEDYEAAMIERYGEDKSKHPKTDNELWLKITGGKSHGRIYGAIIDENTLHINGSRQISISRDSTPSSSRFYSQEEVQNMLKQELATAALKIQQQLQQQMQQQMQHVASSRNIPPLSPLPPLPALPLFHLPNDERSSSVEHVSESDNNEIAENIASED